MLAVPCAHRSVTGSRETPITVITTPVTTGGKNRSRRVKKGAMTKAMAPATISDPKIARRPSSPPPRVVPMASMVATAANEVPCTMGRRAPSRHRPRVCSSVARPEMNSPALSR